MTEIFRWIIATVATIALIAGLVALTAVLPNDLGGGVAFAFLLIGGTIGLVYGLSWLEGRFA